jgi:hypothetical protein
MSEIQALYHRLTALGVRFAYKLTFDAPRQAVSAVDRETLLRFKAELVLLLALRDVAPSTKNLIDLDDAYEKFTERAAIMEHDGLQTRETAEKAAIADVLQLLRERGMF